MGLQHKVSISKSFKGFDYIDYIEQLYLNITIMWGFVVIFPWSS